MSLSGSKASAASIDPIQDLFGLDIGSGGGPAAAPVQATSAAMDLDDLFGTPAPAMPRASAPQQYPPVSAFQKDGISVVFQFSKPDSSQPTLTDAVATISSVGAATVENFSLQVLCLLKLQHRYVSVKHENATTKVVLYVSATAYLWMDVAGCGSQVSATET